MNGRVFHKVNDRVSRFSLSDLLNISRVVFLEAQFREQHTNRFIQYNHDFIQYYRSFDLVVSEIALGRECTSPQ